MKRLRVPPQHDTADADRPILTDDELREATEQGKRSGGRARCPVNERKRPVRDILGGIMTDESTPGGLDADDVPTKPLPQAPDAAPTGAHAADVPTEPVASEPGPDFPPTEPYVPGVEAPTEPYMPGAEAPTEPYAPDLSYVPIASPAADIEETSVCRTGDSAAR